MAEVRRGRKATGSLEFRSDRWWVRVTLPDGSRPWLPLEPLNQAARISKDQRELATLVAVRISDSKRGTQATSTDPETFAGWSERWLSSRETKGLRSIATDRSRLKIHILPHLGGLSIRDITRSDIEKLVVKWDDSVLSGKMSWKTARNAWVLVSKAFNDARKSKRTELRVREDSPCDNVEGPDRGVKKAKGFLYPSEFLALARTSSVPLRWRRIYALAIYLYVRIGELGVIRKRDIDMEHGVVQVWGEKTGQWRSLPIEAAIVPLLERMATGLQPEDKLVPEWLGSSNGVAFAERFREHLLKAGVKRAELHTNDLNRKHITFHDLRATGITWAAVRGDQPLQIMQRAGHTDFNTTQGYIRTAENLRRGFGEVFPTLPEELFADDTFQFTTEHVEPCEPPPLTFVPRSDPIERFKSFVKINDESGCHEWQGSKNSKGYALFSFGGRNKTVLAHRFAVEHVGKRSVPAGMVVHHVCLNIICVNPDHLMVVSRKENRDELTSRSGAANKPLGFLSDNRPETECTNET